MTPRVSGSGRGRSARRVRRAEARPAGVMLASLGAFFALLAILAVQVRAGGDPALGPAKPAAEVAQRRVIVHRVVLRRVVVTEAGAAVECVAASERPAPRRPLPLRPRRRPRRPRPPRPRPLPSPRDRRERAELSPPWAPPCACSRPPARRSHAVRDGIEALAARLTRFDPASELSVLNADPRPVVPASPLLRHAVAAALLGARRTGGLADPTLLGALEDAGYATSRVGVEPASLRDALRAAPPRRPAAPGARWREVRVDHAAGTIARPPGAAARPRRQRQGARGRLGRAEARAARPLRGRLRRRRAARRRPRRAACAARTRRCASPTAPSPRPAWTGACWQRPDGSYAHHLLDPSTGEPAWTGLIAATALAPTALEAEALAKAALLSGPERSAQRCWPRDGGILVHDSGHVERVGLRPRVRLAA